MKEWEHFERGETCALAPEVGSPAFPPAPPGRSGAQDFRSRTWREGGKVRSVPKQTWAPSPGEPCARQTAGWALRFVPPWPALPPLRWVSGDFHSPNDCSLQKGEDLKLWVGFYCQVFGRERPDAEKLALEFWPGLVGRVAQGTAEGWSGFERFEGVPAALEEPWCGW